jgi:hypothetical protein
MFSPTFRYVGTSRLLADGMEILLSGQPLDLKVALTVGEFYFEPPRPVRFAVGFSRKRHNRFASWVVAANPLLVQVLCDPCYFTTNLIQDFD